MTSNSISILVNSCDAYSDLWEPFFTLFRDYWPDCPFQIILNTESKQFSFPGLQIKVFQSKSNFNSPYGKRMIETVKNIDSDYLIVFMDDFFIRNYVDTKTIFSIFEYMELHPEIACMSEYGMKDRFLAPTSLEHFLDYGDVCKLKVNLAAVNFWRTEDYLNSWKEHETPWEYEAFGTIRSFHDNKKYYTIDEVWNSPILIYETPEDSWLSCVFKGKWILPRVEKLFNDHGINIDYSIRGVYLEDHFIPPATGLDKFHIKKVYRSFKSIGFIWTIRKIQYCIANRLFSKHPVQYIEYIRSKNW